MHEVIRMDEGYFALFMQTGAPELYVAACIANRENNKKNQELTG